LRGLRCERVRVAVFMFVWFCGVSLSGKVCTRFIYLFSGEC